MEKSKDKKDFPIMVVVAILAIAVISIAFINATGNSTNLVGQAGKGAGKPASSSCSFVSESDFESIGITSVEDLSGVTGNEVCNRLNAKNTCILTERRILNTNYISNDHTCIGIQSQNAVNYMEPCTVNLGSFGVNDRENPPTCGNTNDEVGEDPQFEPMNGDFTITREFGVLCCQI